MRRRRLLIALAASMAACSTKQDLIDPSPDASSEPDGAPRADAGSDSSIDAQEASLQDSGTETEAQAPPACGGKICPVGHACSSDSDCEFGCSYSKKCAEVRSCVVHLGGDTCGLGEVGQPGSKHESCCRSLEVPGFSDSVFPGKTVYLDKYEITAGRVRAWIEKISLSGDPDVKQWISSNRPKRWDFAWDAFLPTGYDGGSMIINRRLLGDPRPEDYGWGIGPGVIVPPPTDEARNMGVNYQFNSEIYVDLHGGNCGSFAGSYGFSTFWYPPAILARNSQQPRPNGLDFAGKTILAKDLLDVKSMNCITNVMLAAFCAWDGGQLATSEVLDFVTDSPASLGNTSGCGSQYDNHGDLLGGNFSRTVQTGGRCADVVDVNATFDAGDALPTPDSILNQHQYRYPDLGQQTHDKAWEVAAPGRGNLTSGEQKDLVRISPNDEPWMDLNGNLSEAALETEDGHFTGRFALKFRGVGYGSSRSDLNVKPVNGENILRIQRPEAKAAYIGGRCMRFR